MADFIDGHIASLVRNLGTHDDEFFRVLLAELVKRLLDARRNTADTEALHNNRIVVLKNRRKQYRADSRDQFQEKNVIA